MPNVARIKIRKMKLPLQNSFNKKMTYITRIEHFSAAHKLYNAKWSKEENEEIFGGCANENWHGHNFKLEVTVAGNINTDTGFVMNVKDLSKIINEKIIDKLDHKNLNLDVDFMQGKMCSMENVAMEIWKQIVPNLPNSVHLHRIKLYETATSFVEYFGEK